MLFTMSDFRRQFPVRVPSRALLFMYVGLQFLQTRCNYIQRCQSDHNTAAMKTTRMSNQYSRQLLVHCAFARRAASLPLSLSLCGASETPPAAVWVRLLWARRALNAMNINHTYRPSLFDHNDCLLVRLFSDRTCVENF